LLELPDELGWQVSWWDTRDSTMRESLTEAGSLMGYGSSFAATNLLAAARRTSRSTTKIRFAQ
jgi:hypothetical protein